MGLEIRTHIKNCMSSNLFLYDRLIAHHYRVFNDRLESIVRDLGIIDSISDYGEFRETMMSFEFPKTLGTYTIKRAYSENTLYGYAESVLTYAGINKDKILYFPLLVHGIPYSDEFSVTRYGFHNSFIFQGTADSSRVMNAYPSKKVYNIGPYIYYCESYYDKEKEDEIKRKNGKTALLFLKHSSEESTASLQVERLIDRVLNHNGLDYDTILICVYCQDVNNVSDRSFTDSRIKCVSAGYKLDPLFCSRLKTILALADTVFFDGFSSSIGYAHLLGKQIISFESEKPKTISDNCGRQSMFHQLYHLGSESSEESKRQFIDKYWGLTQIKTKDEIRQIFQSNYERIIRRRGFFV